MIECKLDITDISGNVKCAKGYCKVSADSKLKIREELIAVLTSIYNDYPDIVYDAMKELLRRSENEQNDTDKHNSK